MSPHDLLDKMRVRPFKPFRVRLANGEKLDVPDLGLVMVGPTSAVMPICTSQDDCGFTLVEMWRTVALSDIVQFVDRDPPKPSPKRRCK